MIRILKRSGWVGLLLAVALQGQAAAATVNVSMVDSDFVPPTANARPGDTVHWTNDGVALHTTTGNAPLSLWDSGAVSSGDSFDFVFTAAGRYPYVCEFHAGIGMAGTISVPINVMPRSGPVGTLFRVTVASVNASSPFVYDIQKANPGGGFTNWMTGITARRATFDSTGMATGTYRFRSRLRNTSTGATSSYSVAGSATVTP